MVPPSERRPHAPQPASVMLPRLLLASASVPSVAHCLVENCVPGCPLALSATPLVQVTLSSSSCSGKEWQVGGLSSPGGLCRGPGKLLSQWLRNRASFLGGGALERGLRFLCELTVWQDRGPPAREHSLLGSLGLPGRVQEGAASEEGPKDESCGLETVTCPVSTLRASTAGALGWLQWEPAPVPPRQCH